MESPRPMLHSARRGVVEATGQAARPGGGWCPHAGAGGRTLDRQGATAVAGSHTPGWGRSYLLVETPRLIAYSGSRGGVEATGQAARPGRGRCAHAGREGGHLTDKVPWPWPVRTLRGGGGGTCRWRCPGRCYSALVGVGWQSPGRPYAPVVAGARTPERDGGHQAGAPAVAGSRTVGREVGRGTRQRALVVAGWRTPGPGKRYLERGRPADAIVRRPARGGCHRAGCAPWSWAMRAGVRSLSAPPAGGGPWPRPVGNRPAGHTASPPGVRLPLLTAPGWVLRSVDRTNASLLRAGGGRPPARPRWAAAAMRQSMAGGDSPLLCRPAGVGGAGPFPSGGRR